jgi:hypothetical protein
MWLVSDPAIVKRRYPAGAGAETSHALVFGEHDLAPRVEYVDWRAPAVQIDTCEQCGQPGCASGNFVELRRAGDFVVWAPCPRAYDESDVDCRHYEPPHWALLRGFPAFDAHTWNRLRKSLGHRVPAYRDLPRLLWRQAWLIAQLESARHLLGKPGSEGPGDLAELVATDPHVEPAELARLLHRSHWAVDDAAATIERAVESDSMVMYFNEHPDEARVLARHDGQWRLGLGALSIFPASPRSE